MVYMLFDNPADKQNMTFLGEYETASIGIFLVVLGHALVFSIRTKNPYVQFMYKMIYYFHICNPTCCDRDSDRFPFGGSFEGTVL